MILRVWLGFTVVLLVVAWYLALPASPAPYQASPPSFVGAFIERGLVPKPDHYEEDEDLEHEAFEVPPEDATRVPEGAGEGLAVLLQGREGEVRDKLATLQLDRTIELAMEEWGFDPGRVQLKAGETVALVIENTGNIPHEFMIMADAAMKGVNYRLARADWNLTEHEAVAEQSFLLPGERMVMVVRADKPGMWMFMCMFPYHMQLGMMGMLMAADEQGGMPMGGDMKM